jgi:hypothetical protein
MLVLKPLLLVLLVVLLRVLLGTPQRMVRQH